MACGYRTGRTGREALEGQLECCLLVTESDEQMVVPDFGSKHWNPFSLTAQDCCSWGLVSAFQYQCDHGLAISFL